MFCKKPVFLIVFSCLLSLPVLALIQPVQSSSPESDAPVPKSETIVIPGSLNDSKQNAQSFNSDVEFAFGSDYSVQNNSSNAKQTLVSEYWRKTAFNKIGTLVVTLDFKPGSDYSVEVYNSCSNTNFCQAFGLGNFKACVMNIKPGEYYFKVVKNSGIGSYNLDVDLIQGKRLAQVNAWECNS